MIDNNKKSPLIVIFGRTNVGKSTLFNRLTEKQQALIADIEGTTRDSNIGKAEWRGKIFTLVDTGGIIDLKYLTGKKKKTGDIEAKVQYQARDYLERADLILFLVDARAGLMPQDRQMAIMLKQNRPTTDNILLVANKSDNPKIRAQTAEFHKLALGDVIPVSAATGSGTGDLLDIIVKKLNDRFPRRFAEENEQIDNQKPISVQQAPVENIKVSILGKPNVGKSSLLNAVLGESRVIVSPIPHTTREPQDTELVYRDTLITLIDTAGISRKGMQAPRTKTARKTALEKFGITKSLNAMKRSDIVLLVLDINEPITHQETKIVSEIINAKKSLVIVANKWDLITHKDTQKYTDHIYTGLPFITWAPVQFTSALTGAKTKKILDQIIEINQARNIKISDSDLNRFLKQIISRHKPAKAGGTKHPRIHGFRQTYTNPPEFTLRIGPKDTIHFSYVRFIENRLRDKYGFLGTPLTIRIIKRKINQ